MEEIFCLVGVFVCLVGFLVLYFGFVFFVHMEIVITRKMGSSLQNQKILVSQ